MAVATNALPDVTDALAAPYWAAAREHRLSMQQCADCGFIRWAPAEQCPRCLSLASTWVDLSGDGTIYSYVVYRRSLNPNFPDVPFTVVQVALEEGPIMITRLVDEPEAARVGAAVHVVFTYVTEEVTLPNFALS
ncbi:hypothetical protein GCM10025867_36830 [Frondihabitans sucicola]|uniref:Zn-ribbon domain-containing OB-fold protein n=1 Tax=Frondihabitans sucicola TaxID=1268041 RepID=A0ABM8GT24_9MICO|nr:OB-fold domain-containing protein [Frondihabitans sucicola]BDZ51442.1 hypothetical protein GCM10025867_36830 [Frondihabitans sucicola]